MRKLTLTIPLLLAFLLFLAIFSLPDRNLHVVFCDVGQGDAILVSLGAAQFLFDGGPDNKVLNCLSRHMPFWDRKIEAVILSHPQEDHMAGLVDVLRRFKVGTFLKPEVEGKGATWDALESGLATHKASHSVRAGQSIRYGGLSFDIFNPLQGYLGTDLNAYSMMGKLSWGNFDVLLTGDIGPPQIDQILEKIKPVEVLKVPHHGSKNGLTQKFLEAANPKLAVISVGKNNRYGHPHEEILEMLAGRGIKTLRTDTDGEIEIVSDEKKWWVELD